MQFEDAALLDADVVKIVRRDRPTFGHHQVEHGGDRPAIQAQIRRGAGRGQQRRKGGVRHRHVGQHLVHGRKQQRRQRNHCPDRGADIEIGASLRRLAQHRVRVRPRRREVYGQFADGRADPVGHLWQRGELLQPAIGHLAAHGDCGAEFARDGEWQTQRRVGRRPLQPKRFLKRHQQTKLLHPARGRSARPANCGATRPPEMLTSTTVISMITAIGTASIERSFTGVS